MAIIKADVASRIRQFAEARKLKLKDLAELLDMTPQSLQSGYLAGRSIPGPDLLIKFHNLGCDIVWLLTGNESNDEAPIDISVPARTARLLMFVNEKGWSKAEIAEKLEIHPRYVDKCLNGEVSIYNLAGGLHNQGADMIWMLTGVKSKNIMKRYELFERLNDLEAENAALRAALSPDLVEMILKRIKKGKG